MNKLYVQPDADFILFRLELDSLSTVLHSKTEPTQNDGDLSSSGGIIDIGEELWGDGLGDP